MAERPHGIDIGPHTADDGLYGPDSVTWRVMASPAVAVGASAAAMVQMLYPPVMYVIDQASGFRTHPESRAKRTGDYTVTITYGDVASAEQAGEVLRNLHATRRATDPSTGQEYQADDPDLLIWVHHSLTWTLLRAVDTYGPSLSPADANRFVSEQRDVAARLVGCDLERIVGDVGSLSAYMESMTPRLALTTPALWFRDMMVPPSWSPTPTRAVTSLLADAAVLLMGREHQLLYGFRYGALRRAAVVGGTRALLASGSSIDRVADAIPALRSYVDENAFGGRRRRATAPH